MKKSLLFAGLIALGLCASAHTPKALNVAAEGVNEGVVAADATELTVNYKLNFDADTAFLKLFDGETVVKEVALGGENLKRGEHSVALPLEGLEAGVAYTYGINVVMNAIAEPKKVGPTYTFWSPYGIAIDNNPESPYFGRILVTEAQPNMGEAYWTSVASGTGVGSGIYAFDANMDEIPNANGTYGFNGGTPFQVYKYSDVSGGYSTTEFGPKVVRIADDGRIFLGTLDVRDHAPMYLINPANLDEWTPFFVGEQSQTANGNWNLFTPGEEPEFVGGYSACFDVQGSGENLKLVNMSCNKGQVFVAGSYETFEYPVGSATQWAEPADFDNEVVPISMRYAITAQTLGIAYDPDGNIWWNQYRAQPNASQPSLVHCSKNADGEWIEDYTYIETMHRGGIRYNLDYSLLAIPQTASHLGFFEVSKGEGGAPVLNQKYEFVGTGIINAFNDMAFDYEGDCYAVDNSKEVFIKIAMPQEGKETLCMGEAGFEIEGPAIIAPESITLNYEDGESVQANPGDEIQIRVLGVSPAGADASVVWSSGNEMVATVSETGLVNIAEELPDEAWEEAAPARAQKTLNFRVPVTATSAVTSDVSSTVYFLVTYTKDATGVASLTSVKAISSVKYVNAAGQVSDVPFSGVNMMVTEFEDGTQSVVKIVK